MKRDVTLTLITQFFVILSTLALYKFAKHLFGDLGFAEFSLVKRNIALISPALILGLNVSIPRYVSLAIGKQAGDEDKYFIASFMILSTAITIFGIFFLFFRGVFAHLLFSDSSYRDLIPPIYVAVFALVFHTLAYSYFRGKLQMFRANLLQLINFAIVPLAVFIFSKSVVQVFLWNGVIVLGVTIIAFMFISTEINMDFGNLDYYAKESLGYGVQRVFGDFGLAALISLPAIITTHTIGIKEAGYVAFGISLLNMVGQIFAPLGLVFLPKVSQLLGSGDLKQIGFYIKRLFFITLIISIVIVAFYEMFAGLILQLYLGNVEYELISITRLIILSSVGYSIYVSLRSIIDAYYKKAINTINIVISLLLYIMIVSGAKLLFSEISYTVLIYIFIVVIYILTLLTLWRIGNIFYRITE